MIKLQWAVNEGGWYTLERFNFTSITNKGVYVIWHDGNPGQYVRVGQGNIGERLTKHKEDAVILAYKKRGILRVTWATVPVFQLDGIELFLAQSLKPLVGDRFPDAQPVQVNLPGAA